MPDVVVLGAGPTGLMAALQATKAGHDCTVLEASSHVGGMAGSFEIAGQRVDYGSHRLHPATPPVFMDLIADLLGSDLQLRPRSGRIHLGGRWVGFPLRATNLVRTLPPSMTARLVSDSLSTVARKTVGRSGSRTPTDPSETVESFHDAIVDRFGSTVADEFYGPFATKLYGIGPENLSVELAQRRVSASSPIDVARRVLGATRPEGRGFYYPKRGYGQIAERLAEAAIDAGATVELNAPVTAVTVTDHDVTVAYRQAESPVEVTTSTTLSTIPVTTLAAMTEPAPPAEVATALGTLRTRAMILVYLVIDRPQYTPFDAHYIPGLDTTVARLSEPKNYRDGDDPADTTVLCAEIACWTTDPIWDRSAEQLADLVVEDLARIGLPDAAYASCEVRRLSSVYPVYDIATSEARAIADGWTGTGGRLLTLGRQGLRVIDNLHHVLAMGDAAVDSIGEDGTIDAAAWRIMLDRFSLNTVED